MKYPIINRQARRVVNIPQLSGGLNLRDSLTGIRDNQMTDCINMWYKDGRLKTRPIFMTDIQRVSNYKIFGDKEKVQTRFHDEVKVLYEGCNCIVASNKKTIVNENGETISEIEFEFQAVDKTFVMPKISGIAGEDVTYFCVEFGDSLYCYVSDFSIWRLDYKTHNNEEPTQLQWEGISFEQRYIPTVYVHCTRSGWDDFEGTFFEGYNLINNRYKMIYSAYNVNDSDKSHPMRYNLGNKLPETGEITVEVTSYNASSEEVITVEHKIIYDKEEYESFTNGKILIEKFNDSEESKDGLYLFVKYNYVGFLFEKEFSYETGIANIDTDELIARYACSEDNIVITAPYTIDDKNLKKVFCMTRNTWFGGGAGGLKGGSRLFLCSNTENDEKSLVVWSGLNEPLYFGENCYAYVGSKSRAITTFGKQGENLIIFKENKIYASSYNPNTDIDADNLIDQTVVDYEANSVYFPFVLINGFIGCDCPDTVQMCRNRLVWANSEGKIYTLCTMSQYNEHTVYELSDMVMPKLKEYKGELQNATSADFDGHYILFLKNCAFVMNYCCYGYQYVYSYSRSEDANALIPWYVWKFSFLDDENIYNSACVGVLDGVLLMRAHFTDPNGENGAYVSFTMDEKQEGNFDVSFCGEDDETLIFKDYAINCLLKTKQFEFGSGIYNVTIDNVAVKLGANNIADVFVSFITDQGEEIIILRDNRNFNGVNNFDFIRGRKLYPCTKNIVNFGLKIECEGQMCIDGMSIQYKLLGGVK